MSIILRSSITQKISKKKELCQLWKQNLDAITDKKDIYDKILNNNNLIKSILKEYLIIISEKLNIGFSLEIKKDELFLFTDIYYKFKNIKLHGYRALIFCQNINTSFENEKNIKKLLRFIEFALRLFKKVNKNAIFVDKTKTNIIIDENTW